MSDGAETGRGGLELGELAGRYRLVRPLGRGGMAEVYVAHDEVLDRDVAVKVLLARLVGDASFLERFRREARAAAALSHPNVVAVHDTGDEDGLPFIVMELVDGRSLDALLPDGRIRRERALEICAEVCSALAYAHDRGIVHRDVKPGNVLIADDGTVKVTDFGIARAAGTDTLTTSSVLGTASYLSPEQARGEAVDGRSDLYSLGVVLYELTTGRVPFHGGSVLQVALRHVADAPQRPSALTDLDPALEAVILKALAKDPAERYQSAEELRAELLAILRGEDVTADLAAALAAAGTAEVGADDTTPLGDATNAAMAGRAARDTAARWRPPRSRRLSYLAVGLLALVALAVLMIVDSASRVSVPPVVGLPEDEARRRLEAEGLTGAVVARVSSLMLPAGQVIASDPPEGTRVEAGQPVALAVSTGRPPPPAVAPRPPPPPRPAAGGEDDKAGGKEDKADEQAEDAKDQAEAAKDQAEDQAEAAKDQAEDAKDQAEAAKDQAEDQAEEDKKGKGRRKK